MRVHVINPNSTQSMTDMIGACARSVASPGTEIFATNPASAPASIEGQYDEAMSIAGLLAESGNTTSRNKSREADASFRNNTSATRNCGVR